MDIALSHMDDLVYVFDLDGRVLYANQPLLALWQKTLEQVVGKTLLELGYPEELAAKINRQFQEVIQTRQRVVDSASYVTHNGKVGYHEYVFSPVLARDGTVQAVAGTSRVMTARREIEQDRERLIRAIEIERANLASVIKTAPAFMCVLRGREHRVELANERYLELISHRDLLGKTIREALPEVETQGFIELLDHVYSTGEPFIGNEVPVMLSGPDGSMKRFVVNFVYQALRDPSGNVSGIFVHGVDVTDLIASREALREREERFRLIADATPQIVWSAAPDGTLDYYNRRWYEFTKIPEGRDASKLSWQDYVHPEDLGGVEAAWVKALRTGEAYSVEIRIRGGDGEYRWFLVRAEPARDGSGQIFRWYGTATDITYRKRSEARDRFLLNLDDAIRPLSDSEEITATYARLLGQHLAVDRCAYADVEPDEDTFNLTGDYTRGVPSIVGRYRFIQFGREVLDLMRANKPYVVQDVDQHQPPIGDLAAYRATMIQAVICVPLHKRGRFVAAMAVHQKVPRRWTSDEVELVQHVAARCWESIERARISREREQLLESEQAARVEAERAGRMKDEFLATLSHELRTPLNAILGWSTILRQNHDDPEDVAQGLEVIERNARSQSQIIEDLLDMSRIISGKVRLDVQRVDIHAVVAAAIDTARPTADAKGVHLESVVAPLDGLTVSGDANRLQQVLWNLLSNAIKFTPRGGRVQVVLERVNSHIEISVIDTGEGIKPEFLPYVFDRFRQADASTTRRHGGLGLGLSIVKQLVELHGGSVRVKSGGSGQGSAFIVALPVSIREPARSEPSSQRAAAAPAPLACDVELGGLRVLVVDDEPDARNLIRRFLEDSGAVVASAGSASEALRLLSDSKFDILVSDVGMPGGDGYDLIRRVRSLPSSNRNLPAIALTAYARAEDRIKAIAAGFQMHVAKPVEAVELLTVIAGATGRIGRA